MGKGGAVVGRGGTGVLVTGAVVAVLPVSPLTVIVALLHPARSRHASAKIMPRMEMCCLVMAPSFRFGALVGEQERFAVLNERGVASFCGMKKTGGIEIGN